MGDGRRVAKVGEQLKREISQMLVLDKTLRKAVSPEERLGVDSSISSFASVTDVVVSGDLDVMTQRKLSTPFIYMYILFTRELMEQSQRLFFFLTLLLVLLCRVFRSQKCTSRSMVTKRAGRWQ